MPRLLVIALSHCGQMFTNEYSHSWAFVWMLLDPNYCFLSRWRNKAASKRKNNVNKPKIHYEGNRRSAQLTLTKKKYITPRRKPTVAICTHMSLVVSEGKLFIRVQRAETSSWMSSKSYFVGTNLPCKETFRFHSPLIRALKTFNQDVTLSLCSTD